MSNEGTMRKSLYALSVAVLAGFAPALAQDGPRLSFAETVKFILFADSSKSESLRKEVNGAITKVVLAESDEKACSVGVIIQLDKPNYGETKETLTLDFKAVTYWRRKRSSLVLAGDGKPPLVVKSFKVEWLRIDTDEAKDDKVRHDEVSSLRLVELPAVGDEQRATEAMSYLMDTLCPRSVPIGPATKF